MTGHITISAQPSQDVFVALPISAYYIGGINAGNDPDHRDLRDLVGGFAAARTSRAA